MLDELLSNIANCLELFDSEEDSEKLSSCASALINYAFQLGQAVELKRADINDSEIQSVINKTVKWRVSAILAIEKALTRGTEILDRDWAPYAETELGNMESAYYYLSAEQFFLDLFRSTGLHEHYHYFELPQEDDAKYDLVEERVEQIGALPEDRIPPGIPESHWWWWAPEKPPVGGSSAF